MTRNRPGTTPTTQSFISESARLAAAHDAARLRATRLRQEAIAAFWQQLAARLRNTLFSARRRGGLMLPPHRAPGRGEHASAQLG